MARAVLVGLPGVGKSSVGALLGQLLGCDVVDTDELFRERVGESPASYLRTHAETLFRAEEALLVLEALGRDAIVSTGGGAVTSPDVRTALADERVVWLDCDDATLLARMAEGDRPLLDGDRRTQLAKVRENRREFYEEVATWRVDAGGPLEAVTREIMERLNA